jgi:hypothetical protein
MKTHTRLVVVLFAITLFSACNSDSAAPKQDSAIPPASKDNRNGKPELWLYAVTVNDLVLRSQPTKNSNALGKMPEGSFCQGSGVLSANREEATLRDMQYYEPFYKVKTLSGTPKEGWAYGGGLLCIYTGEEKNAPSLDKISVFSALLKKLNAKQLSSGKQAWDFVKKHYAESERSLTDAVFFLLQQYLRRMEFEGDYYTQTEQFPWTEQDQSAILKNSFDYNKYPLTRQLAVNGFRLAYAEGVIFPVVDYQPLNDFFSSRCSPAVTEYLAQSLEEQLHPEFEDGAIVLPLVKVADRAVFWENFNKKHPYFPLADETTASEQFTRQLLVTGSDNTPIYDYETKKILSEYREMWDHVVSNYPNTATGAQVKAFRDLCAQEQWKYTKAIEQKEMEILGLPAEE